MTDLTDRYLGATLRSIPDNQRTDIEAELRTSIEDAVEARVAAGEPREAAEEAVLNSLGDPDRLAAGYTGRPGYLIGPELFFDYKRLLTVLLITVTPIVAVVVAAIRALSGEELGAVVGGTASLLITLVVHIVFWTTLVFAVIQWSGEKSPSGEWTVSSLPPLIPVRGGIKLSETIGAVVFLVIVMVGIVLSRDLLGVMHDGAFVPIFDPAMWDFWIPFLIAVLAAELLLEVVKYRAGRWTWPLASLNLAVNAAFAIPVIYLLLSDRLFNPAFFEALNITVLLDVSVPVAVAVIVALGLWDVVDGFRKAWKAG